MNPRPPAEATLARVLPLAPQIGVTRVAVLTGLDVIGIPVAAAIRPNSRTVAVHQGKGATLAQAKVSALMEALECHCAEMQMLPLRLGTVDEMSQLGKPLDVRALPRCRGGPDPAAVRLLWLSGTDLATGAPVWVPRELVAADFSLPAAPGTGVFQATTNGLASGNTLAEALLHGLCEVIERDAVTLWNAAPPAFREQRLLEPDSVDGPLSAPLLKRCRDAGVDVVIADATTDIGVPVMAALLSDPLGLIQPEIGTACRPDRDAALAGALSEAAQARLTVISGARDDMEPEWFDAPAARDRLKAATAWHGVGPSLRFGDVPTFAVGDPVEFVLRRLVAAGVDGASWVDLTLPRLGLPVVRVVVPGLEGPREYGDSEYRPGTRMRRWLAAA